MNNTDGEMRDNRRSVLISVEAAEWFVRLRDDSLELVEQLQYVRWLSQSPTHIVEMLRLCRIAGWLRGAELGGLTPHQAPASSLLMTHTRSEKRYTKH